MRSRHFSAAITISVTLLTGCGSLAGVDWDRVVVLGDGGNAGAGGDGGDGGATTIEAACQSEATALCSKYTECSPAYLQIAWGDSAACVARNKAACLLTIGTPGSSRTPDTAAACAGAYTNFSCDDFFSNNLPAACQAKPGMLANGTACGGDSQCVSASCHVPANSICGVCGPRRHSGGACVRSDDCDYGLLCNADGFCTAPGDLGANCGSTPCRTNLHCKDNRCVAFAQDKEPCAAADDCSPLTAEFCDLSGTKTCKPLDTAIAGGICGAVDQNFCTAGSTCTGLSGEETVCVAPADEGHTCDETKGPACRVPARCVNAVCMLPNPATCR